MSSKLSISVEAIDRLTRPMKSIANQLTSLTPNLKKATPETQALALRQQRLAQSLGKAASHLDQQRRLAAQLGREFKQTAEPTKQLTQAHERQQRAVRKAALEHRRLKTEMRAVTSQAKNQGVNLREVASQALKAGAGMKQFGKQQQQMSKWSHAANLSFATAFADAGARRARQALSQPINQIRGVERAKGDLQSLGMNPAQVIAAGSQVTRQLVGVSTASFITAAYDIKSGISSLSDQGVADMTRAAAQTATATKANISNMTSLFATGYGVFKKSMGDLSDADFGDLFGAALSASVQAFKTDGVRMQQAIESAGSEATQLGVSMTEQMAVLGSLQTKMNAGVSGTAYKAFVTRAARAGDALGINTTTADGKLLGISEIMQNIKAELGSEYTTDVSQALLKAFGSEEAVKVMSALWDQTEGLQKNIALVTQNAKLGAEFTNQMVDERQNQFDARWQKMTQTWNVALEELGKALIPVMDVVITASSWLADLTIRATKALPGVTAVLASLVVGIAGIVAVLSPAYLAFKTLSSMLRKTATNATLASGRLAGVAGTAGGISRTGRALKGLRGGGLAGLALGAVGAVNVLMDKNASTAEKATNVAGLGGAAAGAAAGAALGSLLPGIGTAIGGTLGGIIGSIVGGSQVEALVSKFFEDKTKQNQLAHNQTKTVHNDMKIEIVQRDGENSEALAQRVAAEVVAQQEQSERGAFYDLDPSFSP